MSGLVSKLGQWLGITDAKKSMNDAGILVLNNLGLNGARIASMPVSKEKLLKDTESDSNVIPFLDPTRNRDNHKKSVAYMNMQATIGTLQEIADGCKNVKLKADIEESIDSIQTAYYLPSIKMTNSRTFSNLDKPYLITMQVPVLNDLTKNRALSLEELNNIKPNEGDPNDG